MAFKKAKCEPEENIHVGDQILSDIIGAKLVGTNYILIDRYSLNETFEIGVSLGGTNFQKLFSSTLWCVNSISSALAKPSTWLIMPCIPSVNNIPFNLDINYYIDFV